MEKIVNEKGRISYEGVKPEDLFDVDLFQELELSWSETGDTQWALHTDIGSITVLDRETGFGCGQRDTETGYRDTNGLFWLASGMYDVRDHSIETIGEAIEWIKKNANTCIPSDEEAGGK